LGFFGVSVIWSVYNAFVPIFLADRFLMAGILGPIVYGLIIQFSGGAYSFLMLISPIFLALALITIAGVTKGEAQESINY
jgi:hypothetical protein